MGDYRIEKLNDENISDLAGIFANAYGRPVDIDSLRKKFNTEVFGHKHVGFIAYSDAGEPAAFYGVFPCFLKYKGQKIYAAQSGDTMTHKNHQGKGLFVTLAKRTYKYAQSVGIKVVFGFPNENSYPGFVRKLDWDHYEDMMAYLIRVKCIPWIRLKAMFPFLSETHDRICNRAISSLPPGKPFESSVIDEQYGGVDHSPEFFAYKTYAPNRVVSIEGKSVWLKHDGMFLLIGDIERCDEETLDKIIAELKRICFWAGIPYLRFHCSPGVYLEKYFMANGKKADKSYAIGYVKWNCDTDIHQIKFCTADNDTF